MVPSVFNVRVPLSDRHEVFLMNTLSDAQLIVSPEVVSLLDRLSRTSHDGKPAFGREAEELSHEEREAMALLAEHGFVVPDRESDRRGLEEFFDSVYEDRSQLRVTVLTTLQCNFACDYCFQGDHGDYNRHAQKMSLETAAQVVEWVKQRVDEVEPEELVLTFFGGEPLLNLPALYDISQQLSAYSRARQVRLLINIITNGLLLSPEIVDRLLPLGLNGVKVTLDGDRETHNRMRPLRGGQGTFDRIIENIRQVAGKCHISIGGNFDESSINSFPALLDFLREQEFSDRLAKVAFKPVVQTRPSTGQRTIPLIVVNDRGEALKGTCMTAVGAGGGTPCDTCHFVEERMSFLREETKKRGFPTPDGVHMGPCEIHKRHAYTIGPDGSLYACPGFTGELSLAVGHVRTGEQPKGKMRAFKTPSAWRSCGDCSFIPVCAGGCTVASHTELGDMNAPTCHKPSFESALISLAAEAARDTEEAA